MLKNLPYYGFLLVASGAFGQGRPAPGLRPYRSLALLTYPLVISSKSTTNPAHLPSSRRLFEARYPLAQPLAGVPLASIQALPANRLVYYQPSSPVATGAALAGAVASWLLGADPRVQAYQQSWRATGRYDAFSTPRQARPDDLLR